MRLTLLGPVTLHGAGLLVTENAADAARRTAPLPDVTGESVLVTFETDADALAITTRIGEAQKAAAKDGATAERDRIRRVIDEVFAGAVLDDDMQRLVNRMRERIALPGDGRS